MSQMPVRIVASLGRIIAVAILAVLAIWAVAATVIRQPTVSRVPFRPQFHADAVNLHRHVDFLTTSVRPRDADHTANLDAAASYIKAAFEKTGGRVTEQVFVARKRTYRNVICSFGPQGDTRPIIVVGAHYDAFSQSDNLPGADDNASGTAGLLELARLLATQPPGTPLELVAYTTEEPPFFGTEQMGSAIHAEALRRANRDVKAMLCLEMIGYFRGEQRWDSWVLGMIYPRRGDFIGVAGGWADRRLARVVKSAMRSAGGPPVLSFTGPRAMLDASDHRNYWGQGWTAVMITDTAYQRNPNYHDRGDTADTLDYSRMAGVVDGVFNAVLELTSR
jgi:hypothetical protein